MADYLKPKVKVGDMSKRNMKDGMFRNPPTYTDLGGFSSSAKLRNENNGMTLEKGGPRAQPGKPLGG